MSVYPCSCYLVTCDQCRIAFDENDECIVYFETEDDAIRHIADNGWTVTANGEYLCYRCWTTVQCDNDGHRWEHWHPCNCGGAIADHSIHGCGLYRYCARPGCEEFQVATLATLPTIDEPTVPGR